MAADRLATPGTTGGASPGTPVTERAGSGIESGAGRRDLRGHGSGDDTEAARNPGGPARTPRREESPLVALGAFAAGVTWRSIPDPVQTRARLTLRDTLGTIHGGTRTPAGRVATAVARRTAGPTPIPGLAGETSASITAAFAGAVHASALDLDDGHYAGGAIHPASVIVPSLLVAAHGLDVGCDELLTAQVVGYEIGLRAAHLLWPDGDGALYHCTGTAATLGAAAAVARLRGADADTIARAIAIAWAHAPMSTFQLPMVKESIGWSAATALFAADLAAAGFMLPAAAPAGPLATATAPASVSAIDATFTPTPFHRPGAMDDPFVASLGDVWEAGNTYFKPYACCRYTHTAIRSLAEVTAANGLAADDIAAIEVHTHRGAAELRDIVPISLDHAQYSYPFVLATQLVAGGVGAADLDAEFLDDPARLAVAGRVSVHHDPALDAHYPAHYATRLVVHTVAGRRWSVTRLIAPGDPADPMTDDELVRKFVDLVAPMVGEVDAYRWSEALMDPRPRLLAELMKPAS